MAGGAAAAVLTVALINLTPAAGAGSAAAAIGHPATGVGSCTLKGWHPKLDPKNAKKLPLGHRPQTYRPDDYNCTAAHFAAPGIEFRQFPLPHNFHIKNRQTTLAVRRCRAGLCHEQMKTVLQPAAPSNPTSADLPAGASRTALMIM